MANKEVGDWNPMEEAHRNPTFNTYVEGPGSHLNAHQQPFNRGGRGRSTGSPGFHSNDSEFRLHIINIPFDMTQEGLKNVLMEYAVPKRVYISDKVKPGFQTTWGTADFVTYGDAEATMRGCNEKPPYKFYIKFATKKNTVNNNNSSNNSSNNNYNERRFSGQATSPSPRVNHLPLQEVPQKSDLNRKEALQCRLLVKNASEENGTNCPIIQEPDKEGFFLLPSRGEVMAVNARNMSSDHRFVTVASGWKMGINRKYYPPSPGYSETPKSGANSRPRQPSNSSRDTSLACDTDQAVNRQCFVCLTETSGVCGACKNASYCSQACATSDFRRHLPECNVPVPAVLFIEDGNRAVHTPGNQKPFPSTPPQNVGLPKNNFQIKNCDSASKNTGIDIGAAGDAHNCPHYAVKKENTSVMEGMSNKDNMPLANGDNEPNHADTKPMERKSYPGKPTNGWQDRSGNMSSPQQNEQSAGRQTSPFNRQANDDRSSVTGSTSSFKKKKIAYELMEFGISEEVEVIFTNMHGVFTIKTCNKTALETMNNGLASNWASMLPYDSQEDMCVARFAGQPYRGKVLHNKNPAHTKLRVKFIDFGNISMFNQNEIKALPETFFDLPAQVLQLVLTDGTVDMYSQYEEGSILNITPIKKVDGSWHVEIHPKQADNAQSLRPAPPASPQQHPDAVVVSASPPVPTASPAIASTSTVVEEKQKVSTSVVEEKQKVSTNAVVEEKQKESTSVVVEEKQKNIGAVENSAGKSFVSVVAPLGSVAMVTITHVVSEKVFWGALKSRTEEMEAMEAKMHLHLEANLAPCKPMLNDLIAVFHDDCWYRGKVLKSNKLGLIDYGRMIEPPFNKINALPDELKQVPRNAVKYKVSEVIPEFLQVDKLISVQRTADAGPDGSYLVDLKMPAEPCTQQEKTVPAVKVADVPSTSGPSHAASAGITSLAAQQLPADKYADVTVIEKAGLSFWVNLTDNIPIALEMLTRLKEHCQTNSTPCLLNVGDIVAALFDNDWYRAKVLTVVPTIRVQYIDYGNESEVSADQVRLLPNELTATPTQAIKIIFSQNTSERYHDLAVDSLVRVKPVPGAEKLADGSVIVEVEGDVQGDVQGDVRLLAVEMPPERFVVLTIGLPGKTGYACFNKNIGALNKMMCELHETLHKNSVVVCQPQVGAIVAVVFDNIWHRAKVLTVTPQLQVTLVDYGNTCVMAPDGIFNLPRKFYDFPAQAFKIQFMDGTSDEYFNLDETATFEGKVRQKLPDGTVVLEARNLNFNRDEEQATAPVAQCTAPVQATAPIAPAIVQPPVPVATVPVTASPIRTEMPVTTPQELHCSKIEQLSVTSDNQVMVSFTANAQVWVNSVAKSADLAQLMENLELKKGTLQPCNPQVGDYVAVYVSVLYMWHRGKVLGVAADTVSVLLIDYGCVEDATPDMVKALPEELSKLPAQGIPIQFCAGSPDKCPKLAVDDVVFLKVLATTIDGTAIAMVLDK